MNSMTCGQIVTMVVWVQMNGLLYCKCLHVYSRKAVYVKEKDLQELDLESIHKKSSFAVHSLPYLDISPSFVLPVVMNYIFVIVVKH